MVQYFLLSWSQRLIRSVALFKSIFIFWYSHMSTNQEFRFPVIMLNTIFNKYIWVNISKIVIWYVLLYLSTILSSLSKHASFYTVVKYFMILVFRVLLNLSVTIDFPLLCVKYILILLPCNHHFMNLLLNSLPWFTHTLFRLCPDSSESVLKCISDCNTLLVFQQKHVAVHINKTQQESYSLIAFAY